ncbi:bifunctional phosphoglucose/phosphomannose isomerase [Pontibacter anaerobius]|uniref:Bifunctional phosphoglucose/phosphomannose isomerase n=1 Tax=Pontibacter anaerobius TaxID=2993940 RepID=A0ABT3RK93_9BACT|nr:bifunctional phosphoglucose/phosphomannose isomerase [Pontibacter anaerobius]MCX2741918.1 bifunctional phosphoglucose/phosphomannose isomerase [Pontibacter anaerobius]
MKQLIEGFSQQLRNALEIGERATVTFAGPRYNNVVMAGMGGSGICSSILQAYVADKLKVPVVVQKSYSLPAFVGPATLVIASSFSGNTEEAVSMVRQAMEAEAVIGFVTSGGELLRIARANNMPHIVTPADAGPPRACLGFTLVQQLYLLHYAGLLDDTFKTELNQSINLLEEQSGSIKVQASALASTFHNKLPFIYASNTFEAVALRFQQQLNTNAKQLAHVGSFPEMTHNEIEGWHQPEKLISQMVVMCIKTAYDHPRAKLRMDLASTVCAGKGLEMLEVEAMGATFLEQAFYLIHLFDWVALYLADLNGVDPDSNDNISYLKREISKL